MQQSPGNQQKESFAHLSRIFFLCVTHDELLRDTESENRMEFIFPHFKSSIQSFDFTVTLGVCPQTLDRPLRNPANSKYSKANAEGCRGYSFPNVVLFNQSLQYSCDKQTWSSPLVRNPKCFFSDLFSVLLLKPRLAEWEPVGFSLREATLSRAFLSLFLSQGERKPLKMLGAFGERERRERTLSPALSSSHIILFFFGKAPRNFCVRDGSREPREWAKKIQDHEDRTVLALSRGSSLARGKEWATGNRGAKRRWEGDGVGGAERWAFSFLSPYVLLSVAFFPLVCERQ